MPSLFIHIPLTVEAGDLQSTGEGRLADLISWTSETQGLCGRMYLSTGKLVIYSFFAKVPFASLWVA